MGSKGPRSLARRLNVLTIGLIIATSLVITLYFVRAEIKRNYQELVNHGRVTAAIMAQNSEFGIYTEDLHTLNALLEGIEKDPNIAYAAILGADKEILQYRVKKQSLLIPDGLYKTGLPDEILHKEFFNNHDGNHYIDFLAPVVSIGGGGSPEFFPFGTSGKKVIGYVQLGITQEGRNAYLGKFLYSTAVFTSLLLFVGVGLTLVMTRKITSPIKELVTFTQSISEERLDQHIEINAHAEINNLAQSFNQMLSRMKISHDHLEKRTNELKAVNEQLSLLLKSLPIVVYTCEATGDFGATYVSNSVTEVTGYQPEDFTSDSKFWVERIHPDDSPSVLANIQNLMENGQYEQEYRWRVADGSHVWFHDTVRLVKSPEGTISHIVGVWEDISKRKQAAVALARLGMAVEQSAEAIMITDTSGEIQYVNPAFERISGYGRDEVIGKNPRLLKSGQHGHGYYQEMWETLTRGKVWTGSLFNRRKDGTLSQENAVISPVRDHNGNIVNFVAVKRDVTSERHLEEQLRQSQKMEAVGKLAGGIAHDFNNLLTAITGYSEILLQRLGTGVEGREEIEEIKRAGDRAAGLTRQLLAFSRKQMLDMKVSDLNETIVNMDMMLRRLIGEDIELKTIPRKDLGKVRVDSGQIEQVIMNLAINSRDAMPEGGNLTIETSNVYLDEEYARYHPGMNPGEHVMFSVSDTGCGMDENTRSRVFEPFFTTKEVGKGTGLGLSTVYGIVKQSGGNIWVYSEKGIGTTFKVYFPRLPDSEGENKKSEDIRVSKPRGSETLLLAEDEATVRDLIRTVLGDIGYTVLAASNGKEAMQIADAHEGRIDLLLTDVVMPHMSGKELASRFLQKHPKARVLFMSGYTEDAIVHHGVLNVGTMFLQKPFRMKLLKERVREALDQAGEGCLR